MATSQHSSSNGKGTSRRDFVKKSSAMVAGGAAFVSNLGIARGAFAGGDDEIKIALIGCGGRGTKATVQALSTAGKVTLWAVADIFESHTSRSLRRIESALTENEDSQTTRSIAERIQVPEERRFWGLDAYQKAIDSGVDLVILATPPGFRPLQFEAAVQAGKHVFMEKPVAVDAPGIRKVLAAGELAESKGLKVGVGLQRRHAPSYIETVKRIKDGAIGDVLLTRVYWNSSGVWVRSRANFQKAFGHKPTEMEYQLFNWYYFNWLCGDHIVEQHIHNLDVSNWIKDAYPVSAYGSGGRQVRTGKEYGQIFDHHVVEYTYADGTTMLSQCRHIGGTDSRVAEFAVGSQGQAELSKGKYSSSSGDWSFAGSVSGTGAFEDAFQQEHDDLFAAIRRNEPYNETEYGAKSTMTAILGRMATYSGDVITWDDAINSKIDLSPKVYDFAAEPPVLPDEEGYYPVPMPGKTIVV